MENIKIISESKNPLFGRREIIVEAESENSIKKADAEKAVSDKFSSSEDCVAIKRISGNFGSKIFHIEAFVYDSKEAKEQTEPKSKKAAAAQ